MVPVPYHVQYSCRGTVVDPGREFESSTPTGNNANVACLSSWAAGALNDAMVFSGAQLYCCSCECSPDVAHDWCGRPLSDGCNTMGSVVPCVGAPVYLCAIIYIATPCPQAASGGRSAMRPGHRCVLRAHARVLNTDKCPTHRQSKATLAVSRSAHVFVCSAAQGRCPWCSSFSKTDQQHFHRVIRLTSNTQLLFAVCEVSPACLTHNLTELSTSPCPRAFTDSHKYAYDTHSALDPPTARLTTPPRPCRYQDVSPSART